MSTIKECLAKPNTLKINDVATVTSLISQLLW